MKGKHYTLMWEGEIKPIDQNPKVPALQCWTIFTQHLAERAYKRVEDRGVFAKTEIDLIQKIAHTTMNGAQPFKLQ